MAGGFCCLPKQFVAWEMWRVTLVARPYDLRRLRAHGLIQRIPHTRRYQITALRRAGVPEPKRAEGFHALRHFYASVLLDGGESIKALSEYLGHADPGFTLRTYTHLMPSSSRAHPPGRRRRISSSGAPEVVSEGNDSGASDGLVTA